MPVAVEVEGTLSDRVAELIRRWDVLPENSIEFSYWPLRSDLSLETDDAAAEAWAVWRGLALRAIAKPIR